MSKQAKKINEQEQFLKLNTYEQEQYKKGKINILGIDEVGRGPLAGDVVVAGVILDKKKPIYGLNDSKKISEKKRLELSQEIKKNAKFFEIVSISNYEIDQLGISNAIRKGVKQLIDNVEKVTNIDFILIDYMKINLDYDHLILKKGDQLSNSIAAASIIAKVYRDQKLIELGEKYPNYKFENHKGYGTKVHVQAIKEFGVLDEVHRLSFEPIKSIIKER